MNIKIITILYNLCIITCYISWLLVVKCKLVCFFCNCTRTSGTLDCFKVSKLFFSQERFISFLFTFYKSEIYTCLFLLIFVVTNVIRYQVVLSYLLSCCVLMTILFSCICKIIILTIIQVLLSFYYSSVTWVCCCINVLMFELL